MLPTDFSMAVNGPRTNGVAELDSLRPCPPDLDLTSVLNKPSPGNTGTGRGGGTPPPPGPVSPGKKRVRISDSPSVMMIENKLDAHHALYDRDLDESEGQGHVTPPRASSPRARRGLSYPSPGDHSGRVSGGFSRDFDGNASWEYSGEGREYYKSALREYREVITTVDHLTFPDLLPTTALASLHSTSDSDPGLSPYRDANSRVLLLHDATQGLVPPLGALDGRNGTVFVKDRVTGWPLKRSPSLESRDNPFLPGGDLSKEAEELLKNATIVRDKFYLDEQGRQQPIRGDNSPKHTTKEQTSHESLDGNVPNATRNSDVLEERISPSSVGKAEAAPLVGSAPHPRENGKAGDVGTSSDGVRVEVGRSPTPDGSRGPGGGSDSVGGDQQDKDKAKRRPKCCVVM